MITKGFIPKKGTKPFVIMSRRVCGTTLRTLVGLAWLAVLM